MSLLSWFSQVASSARPAFVAFGAVVLLALTAGAARADLKVVSKTTAGGRTVTTTSYFKGTKSRIESGNSIVITDSASGKTYILNPEQKTYTLLRANDPTMQQAAGMMQMFDVTANVAPGGKSKVVLGKPVKNYIFNITMKPNATLKAKMAEARQKNPNAQIPDMANVTISIRGEEWVTEAFGVTGSTSVTTQQLMNLPNFRSVAQKFSIIRGVSLESSLVSSFGDKSQTAKTVATAISQTPLPDDLFTVPLGYKLQPMGAGMGGRRPGIGRPGAPAPQ